MGEGGVDGLPSNHQYLYQRLLFAIHQFFESGKYGISSCEHFYSCLCCGEVGRD